jgi:catechol 2,3-dioxygenase-like lactoylglutathione lyase family enzyme
MDDGRGLSRIVFQAGRLEEVREALRRDGVGSAMETVKREDGTAICDVLRVESAAAAGCDLGFLRYPEAAEARIARHKAGGLFGHTLPLRRLDHLAVIAPQLEETTRFWVEVLGVPVHGEVRGRGMVIRQMKVGDAIVELIGPETPESPVASRAGGLISMAAFEVDDVDAAAAIARGRGFNAAEAAVGVLPGSRTSTISPDQLSGVALQLIDFGR